MWSMPAYWNGNVYFWGSGDSLTAFSLSNGMLNTTPKHPRRSRSVIPARSLRFPPTARTTASCGRLTARVTTRSRIESGRASRIRCANSNQHYHRAVQLKKGGEQPRPGWPGSKILRPHGCQRESLRRHPNRSGCLRPAPVASDERLLLRCTGSICCAGALGTRSYLTPGALRAAGTHTMLIGEN